MKKARVLALCMVCLLALALGAFAGCEMERVSYTVTFSQDGEVLKEFTLRQDELIPENELPGDPQRPGYAFDGWFDGEVQFDPVQPVNRDAAFEAKFTQLFDLTFVADGKTVAEFTDVRAGETIPTANIPADPVKEGYAFDGWFNGETRFDFTAPVTAGGTYEAVFTQLFTVAFVNGEETVASFSVRAGETVPADSIPGDLPSTEEFQFVGWFSGETEFDDLAPVTADLTFTARFERIAFALTFGETVVYVPVSDPVLSAEDIPGAPAGNGVFLGWYCDGVKAEAGITVTENAAYEAVFVTEADYLGVWADTEAHIAVIVTEDGVTIGEDELFDVEFTFDFETGSMTFDNGSYYTDTYTLTAVGDTLTLAHDYYDTMYEEMVSETYQLTRCGTFELAGSYLNGTTGLVVLDGGILASFGSSDRYGRLYQEDGAWKLEYYANSYTTTLTVLDVTVDGRGNLVIANASSESENGIYVEADSCARYEYYAEEVGSRFLYVYQTAEGAVYVWRDFGNAQSYAEITGTVAEGEIITIAAGDQTLIAKITGSRNFVLAGSERGTYTGAAGELTLDGFGTAVLGEDEIAYTLVGSIAILDQTGYVLDFENHTYTAASAVEGGISGRFLLDGSTSYSVTFYDFGVLIFVYTSSWSGDTLYPGTYTVADGQIVVEDVYYNIDGSWQVQEDGNVLTEVGGDAVYVKEGYEVVSQLENFEGWFVDGEGNYVSFNTALGMVTYRGQTTAFSANYNGSVLTFTAVDEGSFFEDYDAEYTATVSGETLTIVFDRATGLDEYGEAPVFETVTETYTATEEPVIELDAFAGKWVDANDNTYLFDGQGSVVYDTGVGSPTTYIYTLNEEGTVASFGSYPSFTCTLTSATEMSVYYDDGDYPFTTTATFVEKDAFAGSWLNAEETYYQYVFQFDGYGTITIISLSRPGDSGYNGTGSYTLSGNVAEFELLDSEWTCTLNEDGTMTVISYSYGELDYSGTFTNMDAEEEPDAFAGTWTGTVGMNGYTVICDGLGNININGSDYTYEPGTTTIEVGVFVITMNEDGTMHVVYDDGDYYADGDLTKTA